MRICYVHTADFRNHTGSSIHVKELVKYLSRLHTVTLIVDRWDGSPFEGVHLIELKCPRVMNVMWRALFSLVYVICVLLSGCDLLYAKSPIDGSISQVGRFFGVPLVYEVNGLITEEEKMKGGSKTRIFVSSVLEKVVITCSRHLICVTSWIKENLLSRGVSDTKLTVIENGADTELFTFVDNAREKLHLDPEKQYIGYAGTLMAWQGLDHLLSAVPFIQEELPETQVLIVGGGRLMGWLQQYVREHDLKNVLITGEVPHEEIPLYLSACDVCMLLKKPLSSGYSPLKLYEYMACERPVVASRLHGFECLEKEKAGILVNQENPQEVAAAVLTLLRDGNLRKTMGKNGRTFVLNFHTWEKAAQNVSEVVLTVKSKKS